MGRFYSGDINGKFWFGTQNSNDADFFGVIGEQPSELNYYFDETNLEDVENGVKACKDKLGKYKIKLDKFFKNCNAYNDEMLIKYGFPKDKIKSLLEWYARLKLGQKIFKCIKNRGECEFNAEL